MIKKRILSALLAVSLSSAMLSSMPANAIGFSIKGNVNADGVFDADDVVLLQKWSLAVPDTHIENWQTADICKDNKLDVFDLCLMKQELKYANESVKISSPACKAAAFACTDDAELLYGDNINKRIAPASLTKLLTASVALHYLSPDTVVTVGSEQKLVKSGSSLCLVRQGHKLKLYDLLTGMLMASGNDAAYTVAVTTARAVKPDTAMNDSQAVAYFSELMNNYASSIGMKNSHFTTPEGWDDANQYTTVSDLLILADHAFSIPEIKTITGTYQKNVYFVSGESITWTNTNALLNPNSAYYSADAVGIKTGTTANAGNCLIAAFKRNGKNYLSVVVGCGTSNDRYELTHKMLSQFGVANEAKRSDVSTSAESVQPTTTAETTVKTTTKTTAKVTAKTTVESTAIKPVTTAANKPSFGDPNGDGAINAIDASEMLTVYIRIATNKAKPTNNELAYCDVNKDGAVNAVDASYVLSFYAYNATNKTSGTDYFEDYMKTH